MNARSTRIGLRSASAFLLVAAATVAGSGAAQAATHVWGTAIEVPGMTGPTGLNPAVPWVSALSCASTGNCAVGGGSDTLSVPAWVAEEVNGTWQTAQVVPDVAVLNAGGGSHGRVGLDAISCPSSGECTAVGHYLDTALDLQSWVADEVNGTWQSAQQMPGTAGGSFAEFGALSCASVGNCSAGGAHAGQSGSGAFVVNKVNGIWQTAVEVPGTAALGTGGQVGAVSCAKAGNCSAVGTYTDANNAQQDFAVNEVNGRWGTAHAIPNVKSLNKGGYADVRGISCASAGNCAAVGTYSQAVNLHQPFVVNEVNGTWQSARQVPGMSTLNKGTGVAWAAADAISCRSPGYCSTGGYYHDAAGHEQAFVANEVSGTWHTAHEVPGTATLNKGGDAWVGALSCSSAGNCSAGGGYTDQTGTYQAFVADETAGIWRTAKEVPGTAALNTTGLGAGYGAYVDAMSCVASGPCAAAGEYWDSANNRHVFVVNRS